MTDYLRPRSSDRWLRGRRRSGRPDRAPSYEALAELLGALPSQIALFDNSTHAWNAAFYSVPLRAGDRILTGRDEYGSNVLAYLQIAQRTGAEVVVVPDDDTGQIDVDALADLIDERTKLIGLTWVPTSGGLVNPAAEVGRLARAADVLYLLDATQAVGQFPIDVSAIGCDMLTGTGRKYLRGPRGTGFLYVGQRAMDRLEPFVAEIRSATWDGGRSFTWVDGAQRFETWENSYLNVLGPRRRRAPGARPRARLDRHAQRRARFAIARAVGAEQWCDGARSGPRAVRHRHRTSGRRGHRRSRRGVVAAGHQRQHHRRRAHPVRRRSPRRPPVGRGCRRTTTTPRRRSTGPSTLWRPWAAARGK